MIVNLPKHDLIYNALLIGMDLRSACIYAGLTEAEISELLADDIQMARYKQLQKSFEYSLLEKLQTVCDKQMNMGKEAALTWMLERVNPERWGNKSKTDELPELHIHVSDDCTAEIHAPSEVNDDSSAAN